MEARWTAVTALAPIAWGATYVVTRQLLPADSPLWGSAIRALPAGLLLVVLARRLPRGSWWWRSVVLGTINIAAFFLLVYVAAQALPSSVAASIMALAPLALSGFAWWLLEQRPTVRTVVGAASGIAGVLLLIDGARGDLSAPGVMASASALTLSAFGSVLATRWADGTPVLATTAWQLVAGGTILTVAAAVVEGSPPTVDLTTVAAYAFTSVVATALAFVCWFAGLQRIRAGVVGVIGLLNPVAGVALGVLVAHERLVPAQLAGIVLTLVGILVATRQSVRPSGTRAGLTRTTRAAPSAPSALRP